MVDYEANEPDLPEYNRRLKTRKEKLKDKSEFVKYLWSYEKTFIYLVSFLVLLAMVIFYLILKSNKNK